MQSATTARPIVVRERLSRISLLDALAELGRVAVWLAHLGRREAT